MKEKIIQAFIINGEEDFWSIDDQIKDSKRFNWDLYYDEIGEEFFDLSSSFYNFLTSESTQTNKSTFDQLIALAGIDLSPLVEMTNYVSSFEMDEKIEMMGSEEFQLYKKDCENENEKVHGNITRVIDCLNQSIAELEKKKDLSEYLNISDGIDVNYFKELDKKESNEKSHLNLTQDLRNMLRYTLFAKSSEVETTFFVFR